MEATLRPFSSSQPLDPRASASSPPCPGLLQSISGGETAALAASSSLYANSGQHLAFTESAAVAAELIRQIAGYDEYDGSLESKLRGVGTWAGGCAYTQATDSRSYEENGNAFYLGSSFPKVIPLPPVLRRILNPHETERKTAQVPQGASTRPSPCGVLPLLHLLWAADGTTLHLWPLPSPESPFFSPLDGGGCSLSPGGQGSLAAPRQRNNRSVMLQQQLLSTTSTHELSSPIRLLQHVVIPRSLLPPTFSSSFSFFEPRRMYNACDAKAPVSSRLSASSLPRATSVFRCTYTGDDSLLLASSSHGNSFSALSSTHFHAFVVVTDSSILILALVNQPFPEGGRGEQPGVSSFSLQLYQISELRLDQQSSSLFSLSPFSYSRDLPPSSRQITAIAAHQGASRVFLGDAEGRLYELILLPSSLLGEGGGGSDCNSTRFMNANSGVSLSVKKIRRRISSSARQTSSFSSSRFVSGGGRGEGMDVDGSGGEHGEVASIYEDVDADADSREDARQEEGEEEKEWEEDKEEENKPDTCTVGLLQCQLQPIGSSLFSRVIRNASKALASVVLFSRRKRRRQVGTPRSQQNPRGTSYLGAAAASSATNGRVEEGEAEGGEAKTEEARIASMVADEERGLIWVINAASDVALLVLEPPALSADGTLVQRTNLRVSLIRLRRREIEHQIGEDFRNWNHPPVPFCGRRNCSHCSGRGQGGGSIHAHGFGMTSWGGLNAGGGGGGGFLGLFASRRPSLKLVAAHPTAVQEAQSIPVVLFDELGGRIYLQLENFRLVSRLLPDGVHTPEATGTSSDPPLTLRVAWYRPAPAGAACCRVSDAGSSLFSSWFPSTHPSSDERAESFSSRERPLDRDGLAVGSSSSSSSSSSSPASSLCGSQKRCLKKSFYSAGASVLIFDGDGTGRSSSPSSSSAPSNFSRLVAIAPDLESCARSTGVPSALSSSSSYGGTMYYQNSSVNSFSPYNQASSPGSSYSSSSSSPISSLQRPQVQPLKESFAAFPLFFSSSSAAVALGGGEVLSIYEPRWPWGPAVFSELSSSAAFTLPSPFDIAKRIHWRYLPYRDAPPHSSSSPFFRSDQRHFPLSTLLFGSSGSAARDSGMSLPSNTNSSQQYLAAVRCPAPNTNPLFAPVEKTIAVALPPLAYNSSDYFAQRYSCNWGNRCGGGFYGDAFSSRQSWGYTESQYPPPQLAVALDALPALARDQALPPRVIFVVTSKSVVLLSLSSLSLIFAQVLARATSAALSGKDDVPSSLGVESERGSGGGRRSSATGGTHDGPVQRGGGLDAKGGGGGGQRGEGGRSPGAAAQGAVASSMALAAVRGRGREEEDDNRNSSVTTVQRMQKVTQQLLQRVEELSRRFAPFQGREGVNNSAIHHPGEGSPQNWTSRDYQSSQREKAPEGVSGGFYSSRAGAGTSYLSSNVFMSRPHQGALVEQLVLSYMRDAYTPEQVAAVCWQILTEFSGGNFSPVASVGWLSAQDLHRQLHAFLQWSAKTSPKHFPAVSPISQDLFQGHHGNVFTGLLVRGALADGCGGSLLLQPFLPSGSGHHQENQKAFLEGAMMLGSSTRGGRGPGILGVPSWMPPGMTGDPTGQGFLSPFGYGYIVNREGDAAGGGAGGDGANSRGLSSGETPKASSVQSEKKIGVGGGGAALKDSELLGIVRGAWETLTTGRDEATTGASRSFAFESQMGREEAMQQAKLQDMRRELDQLRLREEEQQRLKGGGPILQRQQPPSLQRQQLEMNIRQLELQIEQQKQQQYSATTAATASSSPIVLATLSPICRGLLLFVSRLLRPLLFSPLFEGTHGAFGILRSAQEQDADGFFFLPRQPSPVASSRQSPSTGTKKRSRLSRLIFGDDTSFELEEGEKIFETAANAGGVSLGSGLPVPVCLKGRFSIAAVSMIQRKLALLFMVIDAVYTAIFQRHVRQRQQQQQQQQAVFASSPSRPFSSSAGGGSLLPASLPPHFSLPSFSAVMAGAAGTGGRKEHHGGWRGGDSIFDDAAASAQAALIWCSLAPHDQDELKHLFCVSRLLLLANEALAAYVLLIREIRSCTELGKAWLVTAPQFDRMLCVNLALLCTDRATREDFRQFVFSCVSVQSPALDRLCTGALFTPQELRANSALRRLMSFVNDAKEQIGQDIENQQRHFAVLRQQRAVNSIAGRLVDTDASWLLLPPFSPPVCALQAQVRQFVECELMPYLFFFPITPLVNLLASLQLFGLMVTVVHAKAEDIRTRQRLTAGGGCTGLFASSASRNPYGEEEIEDTCYSHLSTWLRRFMTQHQMALDRYRGETQSPSPSPVQASRLFSLGGLGGGASPLDKSASLLGEGAQATFWRAQGVALVSAVLACEEDRSMQEYVFEWIAGPGRKTFPQSLLTLQSVHLLPWIQRNFRLFALDLGSFYAAAGLSSRAAAVYLSQGLRPWQDISDSSSSSSSSSSGSPPDASPLSADSRGAADSSPGSSPVSQERDEEKRRKSRKSVAFFINEQNGEQQETSGTGKEEMLQSTGEGTFETAAEQTAQLLAFDQETDPFCVEKSALIWRRCASFISRLSRSPSLKGRLMLLVKAKDLQQQRQQELEAQEQQAASMQDPEILLRSSRLQKRLSQPRGTQSAIAGIAAAGLTSVALEPSSVEMAGISSSSSASPLVSSGSLSIAQISESIQMVSYQQGLLRDCLRLFCFFVLTYASAAARAKLLTHPRGTTGSSNGRRSSSLSPLQRSSSPGRRDKSRDEEVLEKDVVFRESVDEFLQEYFSCKEADGLLAVPSPMNANKAQEWEIFDNLLVLMMKLQACVYSRSELLSVVTAQWRASRQVQEGTISLHFPSITALKLLAEDRRREDSDTSSAQRPTVPSGGAGAGGGDYDEDAYLCATNMSDMRRGGHGTSRRVVEAACGSYLCFAISASKLFGNAKILSLGGRMSVELSRVDAVERALCEDSNVACNPNTLIASSRMTATGPFVSGTFSGSNFVIVQLDDLLTFPDSTLRQVQLTNMAQYLLLLHEYVRERVGQTLLSLHSEEDLNFPGVVSHAVEEMLQREQWEVGGGEDRCSEHSTISAALWPAWMILHRRQHPGVLIQAYMQLSASRQPSSSLASRFGLSEPVLGLILAWLFEAWLLNDESGTSSSTFLKVFNFHHSQGHLPCYDTPNDCLMHSRLSREQKRVALQASQQLKDFLMTVSSCLSAVSTELPYLKRLQQYKTLCSTLGALQQPLNAYISALTEREKMRDDDEL